MRGGGSVAALSRRLGVAVSRIGRIVSGQQVTLIGTDGARRPNGIAGWNQLREH